MLIDDENDFIHEIKMQIAESIHEKIMNDIDNNKFGDFELAGRLQMTPIGLTAFKTRKIWTFDYAILVAKKLGYTIKADNLTIIS
jgi:hypothetical protein